MVTSGTHVNDQCCFDYGNAEVSNTDTGNGHMDAINFSTQCWFGNCWGAGPWVQADLENGLFQSNIGLSQNPSNTGNGAPFVTALLKNNGQNFFALKVANAQTGALTTEYAGSEPMINGGGYVPMHQEGAIVLGTGGDNSNRSIGSFFEGAMTAGLPTDAADDAVQANIVSVGYGGPTGNMGTLTPASEISLRATTACCTSHFLRHQDIMAIFLRSPRAARRLTRKMAPGLFVEVSPTIRASRFSPRTTRVISSVISTLSSSWNPTTAPHNSRPTARSAPFLVRTAKAFHCAQLTFPTSSSGTSFPLVFSPAKVAPTRGTPPHSGATM